MLFFWIKPQPGVIHKSVAYKKASNVVFKSSNNEEFTLPYEIIFVFIWYYIGVTLLEKS